MEGFGVKQIMEELKSVGMTVSKVLHDKDASTLRQVVDVFEDAEEELCVSKYFYSVIESFVCTSHCHIINSTSN